MINERLQYLLSRYLCKSCSAAEKQELATIVLSSSNEDAIKNFLLQAWNDTTGEQDMPEEKAVQIIHSILQQSDNEQKKPPRQSVIKLWQRIAVAASIVLMMGISAYFIFFNRRPVAQQPVAQAQKPADVQAPKYNKAFITLANGQTIPLDSIASGTIAMEGTVQVIKNANGEIVYTGKAGEVIYNTLSNPRGSKVVPITLSDGTKVWLNAESSLKYPIAFTGAERKVEITGEAYFEVAHNTAAPFIVHKDNVAVKVLGTHFNVNAYNNETALKVTLLQGTVKVIKENQVQVLAPGQQVSINKKGNMALLTHVNTEQIVAWRYGVFNFEGVNLEDAMKQISRWYDVEVVYEKGIPDITFFGQISSDINLSALLKIFSEADVHFKIEKERKVLVMP